MVSPLVFSLPVVRSAVEAATLGIWVHEWESEFAAYRVAVSVTAAQPDSADRHRPDRQFPRSARRDESERTPICVHPPHEPMPGNGALPLQHPPGPAVPRADPYQIEQRPGPLPRPVRPVGRRPSRPPPPGPGAATDATRTAGPDVPGPRRGTRADPTGRVGWRPPAGLAIGLRSSFGSSSALAFSVSAK